MTSPNQPIRTTPQPSDGGALQSPQNEWVRALGQFLRISSGDSHPSVTNLADGLEAFFVAAQKSDNVRFIVEDLSAFAQKEALKTNPFYRAIISYFEAQCIAVTAPKRDAEARAEEVWEKQEFFFRQCLAYPDAFAALVAGNNAWGDRFAEVAIELGRRSGSMGKSYYEPALTVCDAQSLRGCAVSRLRLRSGEMYLAARNFDVAFKVLRGATNRAPPIDSLPPTEQDSYMNLLGQVCLMRKDFRQAQECFANVVFRAGYQEIAYWQALTGIVGAVPHIRSPVQAAAYVQEALNTTHPGLSTLRPEVALARMMACGSYLHFADERRAPGLQLIGMEEAVSGALRALGEVSFLNLPLVRDTLPRLANIISGMWRDKTEAKLKQLAGWSEVGGSPVGTALGYILAGYLVHLRCPDPAIRLLKQAAQGQAAFDYDVSPTRIWDRLVDAYELKHDLGNVLSIYRAELAERTARYEEDFSSDASLDPVLEVHRLIARTYLRKGDFLLFFKAMLESRLFTISDADRILPSSAGAALPFYLAVLEDFYLRADRVEVAIDTANWSSPDEVMHVYGHCLQGTKFADCKDARAVIDRVRPMLRDPSAIEEVWPRERLS